MAKDKTNKTAENTENDKDTEGTDNTEIAEDAEMPTVYTVESLTETHRDNAENILRQIAVETGAGDPGKNFVGGVAVEAKHQKTVEKILG